MDDGPKVACVGGYRGVLPGATRLMPPAAAVYWRLLAPLVHTTAGRVATIAFFIVLFVFAPAYLPDGPLTFNVVP